MAQKVALGCPRLVDMELVTDVHLLYWLKLIEQLNDCALALLTQVVFFAASGTSSTESGH